MSEADEAPKRPRHSARTQADKAAREARLAEAMRENLRKRKRQQQTRREAGKDGSVKPS
ncbi:MAG TPA: hypothetical protein VFY19_10645 [Geminicoccaceae bacterium]|nr:hypothetical protein [Geminicoccaceae bacterium]